MTTRPMALMKRQNTGETRLPDLLSAQARVRPGDIAVQPGSVAGLPRGQYLYREGRLHWISHEGTSPLCASTPAPSKA